MASDEDDVKRLLDDAFPGLRTKPSSYVQEGMAYGINLRDQITDTWKPHGVWSSETASSRPIDDIRAAMDQVRSVLGYEPNVLIMGPSTYRYVEFLYRKTFGPFKAAWPMFVPFPRLDRVEKWLRRTGRVVREWWREFNGEEG